MNKILNLTQHNAVPEQIDAGVVEPSKYVKERIGELLTFTYQPSQPVIYHRADLLAQIAYKWANKDSSCVCVSCSNAVKVEKYKVLIGGVPFLMRPLEEALERYGLVPVYAFSKRKSQEKMEDGKVIKTQVFEHLGFVGRE